MSSERVWLVIDDYQPDAGSCIYGLFKTQEQAEHYATVGLLEDYGENTDRVDTVEVRMITLQGDTI